MENWKSIAGYEGLYQVSNEGFVKSLARTIVRSDRHNKTIEEKILRFGNKLMYFYCFLFSVATKVNLQIPFGARSIQDRLRQYGKQCGVGKEVAVSPHAFRRTFCRLKVEAGTKIFVLQRLTGHQSLEVLKRYVEIYGRDLEKAIEQGFD